jgi:hypothetical protein
MTQWSRLEYAQDNRGVACTWCQLSCMLLVCATLWTLRKPYVCKPYVPQQQLHASESRLSCACSNTHLSRMRLSVGLSITSSVLNMNTCSSSSSSSKAATTGQPQCVLNMTTVQAMHKELTNDLPAHTSGTHTHPFLNRPHTPHDYPLQPPRTLEVHNDIQTLTL